MCVCMWVCLIMASVMEGNGQRSLKIWISSPRFFYNFKICWKKAESNGSQLLLCAINWRANVMYGSNWCNKWIISIGYLLTEHWSLETKNTGFVRICLQKDAFRVDTFSVPPKKHKNATTFLIKTNKHITQCLDVVKVNPPKKLSRDPRRLASNSRLAVSLGTLYVSFTFYIRWERDMDDAFWKRWWNATVPRIIDFEITNTDLY